jgi:hypothetical protein
VFIDGMFRPVGHPGRVPEQRGVSWGGAGPSVDDIDIDAAEHALGVRFPLALRAFYLAHNGGWPDDEEGVAPHPFVHGYTPIGDPVDDACLVGLAVLLGEQDARLSGLIPFAYDAGGNTILSPGRDAASPAPMIWLPQTDDLEPCDGWTLTALLPTEP